MRCSLKLSTLKMSENIAKVLGQYVYQYTFQINTYDVKAVISALSPCRGISLYCFLFFEGWQMQCYVYVCLSIMTFFYHKTEYLMRVRLVEGENENSGSEGG